MFQADEYMNNLTQMLCERFGERLVYVGLQGSYLRGEATEDSDIDAMVVMDNLTPGDLAVYRKVITQLGNEEKSCGFICGRAELAGWNPLEICHLLHSTRDYHGRLSELLPHASERDVRSFVKLSIGNLYHEIVHRYVHADAQKNKRKLPTTCKGAFFILQNAYYLETGVFARTKEELQDMARSEDREILAMAGRLGAAEDYAFEPEFERLLVWCQSWLARL